WSGHENGFFFYSRDAGAARRDFDELVRLSAESPLPCRARLRLGRLDSDLALTEIVGLIYPAEHEDEVSRWLLDVDYKGGELVKSGCRALKDFQNHAVVLVQQQLACQAWRESRPRQEVLEAVGIAVQR
ncbi:MAG: hypothetical protein QF662_08315, partial [Phycisphaerae bacterium]|nr:hypothetical protein [Phycisphaerae bacterium]